MTESTAPTTFFREIDRNRRNSWLLVGVVIVVLGLLGGVIGYATGFGWAGVVIAVIVAVAMSIGSYFAGDGLVLASSGAKEVPVGNPPDQYKQLVDVVTEMSLAGGVPMPKVYVIDDTAPNAFATGRDPQHASIAATTGRHAPSAMIRRSWGSPTERPSTCTSSTPSRASRSARSRCGTPIRRSPNGSASWRESLDRWASRSPQPSTAPARTADRWRPIAVALPLAEALCYRRTPIATTSRAAVQDRTGGPR